MIGAGVFLMPAAMASFGSISLNRFPIYRNELYKGPRRTIQDLIIIVGIHHPRSISIRNNLLVHPSLRKHLPSQRATPPSIAHTPPSYWEQEPSPIPYGKSPEPAKPQYSTAFSC